MTPVEARAAAGARTAVVLTHSAPRDTDAALRAAASAAERAGCRLYAPAEELAEDGAVAGVEGTETLPESPDLCLALGGDGTILRGLREYLGTDVPVFGINFGTVGFLAAVEADELESGLRRAFDGEYETISLPALGVDVDVDRPRALNDVSFTRRPHSRVAELSYRLGGQEVGHVRCDGLVAATPAGSTGYNLANNGPILAWGVEGYVVSFVAPHTLTARALVVAPDDVLHVRNEGDWDGVDLALDGNHVGGLAPGEEVEISFADNVARLAQLPGSNFYRRVREKFGQLAH